MSENASEQTRPTSDDLLHNALTKIPMIIPVLNVLKAYAEGKLEPTFKDEITLEDMVFKAKKVPLKDVEYIYSTIQMDNFVETYTKIITNLCADIHTKFEIFEKGSWNQCMEANLDKFENPVNVLYLKHFYFSKCLFLYLTCGK